MPAHDPDTGPAGEAATTRPQDAVDALEQDVLGDAVTEPRDTDGAPDEEHAPAFDIDLDPDDQGSPDEAAANPD